MLYDIGLRIVYEYDSPANAGRHLLRLMPANLVGEQRVILGYLDIQPAVAERFDRIDYFGNATVEIAFLSSHEKLEFKAQCRVERLAQGPRLNMSPTLDRLAHEIAAYRALDPGAPHHFVGDSPRVRVNGATTAFAKDLINPQMSTLEVVEAISNGLHGAMQFDVDATTVDTSPEEAFARRHGVCQDFSHVMIACLRGVGIPAGYVSGFLRTTPPPGKPRLEGADAMHAWVRAWCGAETGWVEIDPTNALLVGNDHVVIARGRDYSDVAPVKGVLRTAGSQTTEQAVDVIALG